MGSFPKFLTEEEVAGILRCSPSAVTEMRESRKLAYIAGAPVLIDEQDLLAYIENMKVPATPKMEKPAPPPPETGPNVVTPEDVERIRRQVLQAYLRRKERERSKGR